MSKTIAGLLFTHGSIGEELLRTAESIIGGQDNVVALSNEGCSASAMEAKLLDALSKEGFQDEVIVFVDLARGSCWVSVERIRQQRDTVHLISGVNLPMLLRFFYKRDSLEVWALLENMRDGGIEGIRLEDELMSR